MFRVVGISFDHMDMGDLLRQVHEHPDAEIAGVFDPDRARMRRAIEAFAIPEDRVFTDLDACLGTGPDLAILCSAPAEHAAMAEPILSSSAAMPSGRCRPSAFGMYCRRDGFAR